MIDYKLFLILILSLVLLYTYNKVESLKLDIKKISNKLESNITNDKCEFKNLNSKDNDIDIEISKFKDLLDNNEVSNFENVIADNEKLLLNKNDLTSDSIVINLDKNLKTMSVEKEPNLQNEKNTTDFSATDNELQDELSNESSDNIIIYSNSQSDKKKEDTIEKLIDKIQDKHIIISNDLKNENKNENENFNNSTIELDYDNNSTNINNFISDENKDNSVINQNLELDRLKDISSYKLKDLQLIAENKNINIFLDNNKKKKTKKDLFNEINEINSINYENK